MSKIDDALRDLGYARNMVLGTFDRTIHKTHVLGLLNQVSDALRLAKAELPWYDVSHTPMTEAGAKEAAERIWAKGVVKTYVVTFSIDCPVVATIPVGTSVKVESRGDMHVVTMTSDGENTPSIKVREVPMKPRDVPCVMSPDCKYEFIAGTAGRVLTCPDCAAQQIPFALRGDDA